ncbi:MAG: hypothetical protein LBC18_04245 [Opitutaceae bacterium]|jgi:hypothetical protein|nr:hypothetical protein [Opitutaceae bacterium]
MPLYINGKRAASLFFNGKSIARAWKNGAKVFQKSTGALDGFSFGAANTDIALLAWRWPQADGWCYFPSYSSSSTVSVWRAPVAGPGKYRYVKWAEVQGPNYQDSLLFDNVNNLLVHDFRYNSARTVLFYDGDGNVTDTINWGNAAVVNSTDVTYTALDLRTKGTRTVVVPKESTYTPAHATSDGHRVSTAGGSFMVPIAPFLYTDSALASGALGYKKLVYCRTPYTPSGPVTYSVSGFMPLIPITYGYSGRYLEANGSILYTWRSKVWPSAGGSSGAAAFVPVWKLDGSGVTIDQTNGVGDQLMSTWDYGGPWAWTTSENARTRMRIHTSTTSRVYGPDGSSSVTLSSYRLSRMATLVAANATTEVCWYDSASGWLKKVTDAGTLQNLWNLGALASIPDVTGLCLVAVEPGVFAMVKMDAAGTGFIASFGNDWGGPEILYSNW